MLRLWRESEGLSVNGAAKRLGVGWKEYAAWEDAESDRRPGLDAALAIERVCGVPVEAWARASANDVDRPTGTG